MSPEQPLLDGTHSVSGRWIVPRNLSIGSTVRPRSAIEVVLAAVTIIVITTLTKMTLFLRLATVEFTGVYLTAERKGGDLSSQLRYRFA